MKEMICIVCPRGCRLRVDEENGYAVSGNACKRGAEYGREEARNPVRMVTSTVAVSGGVLRRCPVRLNAPIPKGLACRAVAQLDNVCLAAPVAEGQVVLENVCGTGAGFIATRSLPARAGKQD